MDNELNLGDPKKIRARLRRYERSLREEKRKYGRYSDGFGKRYYLGALYLLLDDVEGALESFRWFEKEFPDDIGDPGQDLCWTLTLHRSGLVDEAAKRLLQTAFQNMYVIPHLLGEEIKRVDMWYSSNLEWPSYLQQIPAEYFDLWTPREKGWASQVYNSEEFQGVLRRWIAIHKELDGLPRGPRRSQLVSEAYALRK